MNRINNEEELFNWLQQNLYSDLLICKNPLSRWDCYSPERKHRIELKCRERHYPDLLVEKKKHDAMIAECKKHKDIPVYINSTPEGIYAFDMRTHDGIWEIRNMPKTTQFANRHFVPKEVGYFYVDQGHLLFEF